MTAKKKLNTALNRAEKLMKAKAKADAEYREAQREADRVLGEAVRLAVTNSRSALADRVGLSVKEFYSLVVDGEDPSDDGGNHQNLQGGVHRVEPETHRREFGDDAAEGGEHQGF